MRSSPQLIKDVESIKDNLQTVNNLLDSIKGDEKYKEFFPYWKKVYMHVEAKINSMQIDLTAEDILKSIVELTTRFSDYLYALIEDQKTQPSIDDTCNILLTKLPLVVTSSITDAENNLIESRSVLTKINLEFEDSKEQLNEMKTNAQNILSVIENIQIEGKNLVHILSGKVINNFYEKRAKDEWQKAQIWTKWTVVTASATLVTIFAGLIYILIAKPQSDYNFLAAKFLAIATLGLISKWTSKRANRHLTEEAKYHRLAVNIETLIPFTEKLQETTKDKVLSDVASKIFTDGSGNEMPTDYEPTLIDAKSLLEKITK